MSSMSDTTAEASSTPSPDKSTGSSYAVVIAGCAVAGAVILIVVIVTIVLVKKRQRSQERECATPKVALPATASSALPSWNSASEIGGVAPRYASVEYATPPKRHMPPSALDLNLTKSLPLLYGSSVLPNESAINGKATRPSKSLQPLGNLQDYGCDILKVMSCDSGLASSMGSLSDKDTASSTCLYTSSESIASHRTTQVTKQVRRSAQANNVYCVAGPPGNKTVDNIEEETVIGCTLEKIEALVQQFKQLRASRNISVGAVYCTDSFAIGDFDQAGGYLSVKDHSARLTIPRGALRDCQTVYFGVIYESNGSSAEDNFTPVYECGPSGLHFQRPVQLQVRHCIGADSNLTHVSAFIREGGNNRQWNASSDTSVSYQGTNATMDIKHFTGFKLAARVPPDGASSGSSSRRSSIPRPIRSTGTVKKNLYMCCFRCEGKFRLYYMNCDDSLYQKICNQEEKYGNIISSPRKPFTFCRKQGSLIVTALYQSSIARRFEVQEVMSNAFDYTEFERKDSSSAFDISIRQELGEIEARIVAAFDMTRRGSNTNEPQGASGGAVCSPHGVSSEDQLHRLVTVETLSGSLAVTPTHQFSPSSRYQRQHAEWPLGSACGSMASLLFGSNDRLSLTSPMEGCECSAGAASLCSRHQRSLSPTECSDDGAMGLPPISRHNKTRLSKESGESKESGYETSSVGSWLGSVQCASELHGPNSLAAAAQRLHLTLSTTSEAGQSLSSGASSTLRASHEP